jgi:HK97 family phage major capsid protein
MSKFAPPPMPKALKEANGRIEAKSVEMDRLLADLTDDGRFKPENTEAIQKLNAELGDLGKDRKSLLGEYTLAIENAQRLHDLRAPKDDLPFAGRGSRDGDDAAKAIDLGGLFTEAQDFKSWKPGGRFVVDYDQFDPRILYAAKTLMTTGAGFAPPNNRTDTVVYSAQRTPVVPDYIPQDPTTASVVKFMRETTFTNNAATVAEGGAKPESALAYAEASSNVRKIATTLPMSEEQMDDVPAIRGVVDNRLTLMVTLTEEDQVLNGDGTGTNLEGFLSASAQTNGVQVQAASGDSNVIAIRKALTKLRSSPGFVIPSMIGMNPTNWESIQVMQDANGNFIWGHPSNGGPDTLWSLPVVSTPAFPSGTALTGSFRLHSHISRRMGLRIDVGYVNDDFKKNQFTIRAETRLSLEILRYNAFIKVTGLN